MAEQNEKKRLRPSKGWFLLTGAVILVSLLIVFVAYKLIGERSAPSSKVAEVPTAKDTTPGGKANPYYNHLVSTQNQQGAQKASKNGSSFIPTVIGTGGQNLSLSAPPADKSITQNPVTVDLNQTAQPHMHHPKTPTQQATPYASATSPIATELHQLMKQWSPPRQQVAVYTYHSKPATSRQTAPSGRKTSSTSSTSTHAKAANPRPGDVYYAVMDTGLDSDQPGPAMATIVSGRYRGAKVLGSFKRQKTGLVVQFSRLIPKQGSVVSVKAYAVSTSTTRTNVATAVNHHYLARWGGLLAAAFLQGFGEAAQQSGSTVVTTIGSGGGSSLIAHPSRSAGAEAVQALGTVGAKAGQVIQRNFNEPPTVRVAAGTAIDVLIVKG